MPYDREIKLRLYARAGVPEVWLVDLVRNQVEVHREPTPEGYLRGETLNPGDRLVPRALPEVTLSPAQFLG